MNDVEFANILREETDAMLASMCRDGFFYRREIRHDATTWDINNGLCDEFAERIVARVSEAESVPATDSDVCLPHQVIAWRGRFYDAECHHGVERLSELPIAANRGLTRAEVLMRRQLA